MSEEADELQAVGEAWSKRRIGLVLGALLLSACALAYLVYYAICFHPKPSEAAVPTVLFIGLGALVVLLAPWRDLGLVPTEIAGVKFERIVNAQKKEQIAAIVPLQEELRDLKSKYDLLASAVASSNPQLLEERTRQVGEEAFRLGPQKPGLSPEEMRQRNLGELVMTFLRAYRGTFFSPIRIQKWGGSRKGFEELLKFSTDEIRELLFKEVQAGTIDTSISQRGNTLYGISKKNDRS